MSEPRKNSMAAFLSTVVTVIFWLAIVLGTILFVILGIGLLGSLNGGELDLPLVCIGASDGLGASNCVDQRS